MDAVIDRQKSLSGRILGGGRVGGSGGGSGGSRGNSGGGHGRSENGLFEGLRGNIFLLGKLATLLEPLKKCCSDGNSR